MQKLTCYICDECRIILWYVGGKINKDAVTIKNDKGEFHYCAEHAPKEKNK